MARWGHDDNDDLFRSVDFFTVGEHQRQALLATIGAAAANAVQPGSAEEAADRFLRSVQLEVPELTEGAISASIEETPIDVSRDRSLAFQYGAFAGPHMVPGITASFHVPFIGDKDLFRCRPNTYTYSPPTAKVGKGELIFRFVETGENIDGAKKNFDRELANVKDFLGWLQNDAAALYGSLRPAAIEAVKERRRRLDTLAQGTTALGIPIRRQGVPPTSVPRTTPASPVRPPQAENYDVALSFAGENRPFVEDVAGSSKAPASRFFTINSSRQICGAQISSTALPTFTSTNRVTS